MTGEQNQGPGAGGGIAAPVTVLGVVVGGGLLWLGTWLGGTLGAALGGGGWAPPSLSIASLVHLLKGGPAALWPAAPTGATVGAVVVVGLVLVALAVAGVWAWRRFNKPTGLAANASAMAPLMPAAAIARARQLRPSLASVKEVAPRDRGVLLGELEPTGPELRGSDEDTYTAVMAPRAGKTTALAVPALLEAPGAAMLTSNKSDAYTLTRRARAGVGTAWTMDLQSVAYAPRELWWDMIASARSIEGATRLASHFVNASAESRAADDFWGKAGQNTLVALFHAAALSGATVLDVLRWLDTPTDRAPLNALKAHNPALASRLSATVSGAVETRDGIYETARQATSCLLDPAIAAWVLPDKHRRRFDPYEFATSKDTLYLLSKDGGGSAAAITAAAADVVLRAATMAAERNGGRLAVPMRAILDEAANVCRIGDLPALYSHLGSRGITPVTILQSYRQGAKVWGEPGMDALWGASTVKLLGAGIDDAQFAENISKLIGKHKVRETSHSHSSGGRSTTYSRREEEIMQAANVRALPRGRALLWATGTPIAMVKLRPWYTEPYAVDIAADDTAEKAALTKRANGTEVIV
ncbi:type IV secretory system conjugative DNA transfer family protein [Streptomyces sp. NPDC001633]|uniref:type IV secretory system conjugative DNA transfer family protein n=1 Tax=Streptomyces sp. NPDC001633 TaxID=3364595 RepID=UPI00367E30AB